MGLLLPLQRSGSFPSRSKAFNLGQALSPVTETLKAENARQTRPKNDFGTIVPEPVMKFVGWPKVAERMLT